MEKSIVSEIISEYVSDKSSLFIERIINSESDIDLNILLNTSTLLDIISNDDMLALTFIINMNNRCLKIEDVLKINKISNGYLYVFKNLIMRNLQFVMDHNYVIEFNTDLLIYILVNDYDIFSLLLKNNIIKDKSNRINSIFSKLVWPNYKYNVQKFIVDNIFDIIGKPIDVRSEADSIYLYLSDLIINSDIIDKLGNNELEKIICFFFRDDSQLNDIDIDIIRKKIFMKSLDYDLNIKYARLVFGLNIKIKNILNNNETKKIFIDKFPKLSYAMAKILFERKSTIILKKCFDELVEKLIIYSESCTELMNNFSNNLFALLIEGFNEDISLNSSLVLPAVNCMISYLNDENMIKLSDIGNSDIEEYSLYDVIPLSHRFYKHIIDKLISGTIDDNIMRTISKLKFEILIDILKFTIAYMKYTLVLDLLINIYNANIEKSYDEMCYLMNNIKIIIDGYDHNDVSRYIINKSKKIQMNNTKEKISYSFVKYIVNEYPKIKSSLSSKLINRTQLICKSYEGCCKHDSVKLIIADEHSLSFDELYEMLTIDIMIYANMDSSDIIKCKICMEYNIDIVYADCGHTVCKECAKQMNKCPFCRRKSKIYKLIIS